MVSEQLKPQTEEPKVVAEESDDGSEVLKEKRIQTRNEFTHFSPYCFFDCDWE